MAATAQDFDLQGHRGARGLVPENTLASFARAMSIGVSALELDVGMSRDGVLVVSHDPRLKPDITRNNGQWLKAMGPAIRDLSLTEIKEYDVGRIKPGSRYALRFPKQAAVDGAQIPTLKEVIDLVQRSKNKNVRLNVETKLDPTAPGLTFSPRRFAEAVTALAQNSNMISRIVVQSFDWRVLQEVQRLAPEIKTSYLTARQNWLDNIRPGENGPSPWTAGFDIGDFGGSLPRLIKAAGGRLWSPFYRDLDEAQVKEAHELGLKIVVWAVNKENQMNAMIDMGVDGIITDYPDRLRQVLEKRGIKVPSPTPVQP